MQGQAIDDLPSVDANVDFTKIVPIQQKRTIAFINHFVMNTVSYLNNFSQSCESRLMEFEYKLQKVEASLLILESQLSSIASLDQHEPSNTPLSPQTNSTATKIEAAETVTIELPEIITEDEPNPNASLKAETTVIEGIKVCEDVGYKKFFKMVQFGVPESAVKLKMKSEGFNPDLLNTPNAIIPGTIEELHEIEEEDSD